MPDILGGYRNMCTSDLSPTLAEVFDPIGPLLGLARMGVEREVADKLTQAHYPAPDQEDSRRVSPGGQVSCQVFRQRASVEGQQDAGFALGPLENLRIC